MKQNILLCISVGILCHFYKAGKGKETTSQERGLPDQSLSIFRCNEEFK